MRFYCVTSNIKQSLLKNKIIDNKKNRTEKRGGHRMKKQVIEDNKNN